MTACRQVPPSRFQEALPNLQAKLLSFHVTHLQEVPALVVHSPTARKASRSTIAPKKLLTSMRTSTKDDTSAMTKTLEGVYVSN